MMPTAFRQTTDAEFIAFRATCETLAGFGAVHGFEWVDGYLASLAAVPQSPDTATWLETLFGDAFERAYADPESHERALRALQTRLKVLQGQLDPEAMLDQTDALRLDPLIAVVDEEPPSALEESGAARPAEALARPSGADWADGFLCGVRAFPDLWKPPGEEAAKLFEQALAQVAALQLAEDGSDWRHHLADHYPGRVPARDDLIAEACMSVQDLRLLWVDFAPRPETRRVEPVPGRNEPCPCGSGRKYKKCHGA